MGLLAVRATTIPRGKPGMGGEHQEGGLRQKGKQSLLVFRSGCSTMEGAPDSSLTLPLGLAAGSGEMLVGWAEAVAESSPLAVWACGREQGGDLRE